MYEPAWKRLVENLKEEGFQSKYLDRLWDKLSPGARQLAANGHETLKREIIEEMGYALKRAEEKTDLAMLKVDIAAAAITRNDDPERAAELAEMYETERRSAIRARWEFMVHREAIGLIKHDVIEALYPLPRSYASRFGAPPSSAESE